MEGFGAATLVHFDPSMVLTLLLGVLAGGFIVIKLFEWQLPLGRVSQGKDGGRTSGTSGIERGVAASVKEPGPCDMCSQCHHFESERYETESELADMTRKWELARKKKKDKELQSEEVHGANSFVDKPVFYTQKGKSWHFSKTCASSRTHQPLNELKPCAFCALK